MNEKAIKRLDENTPTMVTSVTYEGGNKIYDERIKMKIFNKIIAVITAVVKAIVPFAHEIAAIFSKKEDKSKKK